MSMIVVFCYIFVVQPLFGCPINAEMLVMTMNIFTRCSQARYCVIYWVELRILGRSTVLILLVFYIFPRKQKKCM